MVSGLKAAWASASEVKVRDPRVPAREKLPSRWLMLNCGLPWTPFLVVMMMTPLVALEP